jgi:parallel beta-helix repeat protein
MSRLSIETIIMLIALSSSSQAATITVGDYVGCDFYRIEAAIDAADPGDTIEVHSGEYRVNLNITTPSVVLQGIDTGGGLPVLRAGSSTAGIERSSPGLTEMVQMSGGTAIAIRADFVTVDGFVITGVTWPTPYGTGEHNDLIGNAGIRVYSDFNKISNNTFEGNDLTAIGLWNASNNQILGNTIRDIPFGYGIMFYNSPYNNVERNVLIHNDWGIELSRSESNTIKENEIHESVNDGIVVSESNYTMITENIISRNGFESEYEGNGKGIRLQGSESLVANNIISFNRNEGIYVESIFWQYCGEPPCGVEESYNNLIIGNRIQGNGKDGVRLYKTWRNNIIDNNITTNHGNGISFVLSNNNTAELNNVTKNDHGIYLDQSNYTKVENNTIKEGEKTGIYLITSIGASVAGNNLTDNPTGTALEEFCKSNLLIRNRIASGSCGINVSGGSSENEIRQNSVTSCHTGLSLIGASRNVVAGNAILNCFLGLLADVTSTENAIYGNDLSNNGEAARDEGDNRWDDGSSGNYFGSEGCEDEGRDGVCDAPRPIPGGGNEDGHPLATPPAP